MFLWNLKTKTKNECTKKEIDSDIEHKLVVTKQGEGRGGAGGMVVVKVQNRSRGLRGMSCYV